MPLNPAWHSKDPSALLEAETFLHAAGFLGAIAYGKCSVSVHSWTGPYMSLLSRLPHRGLSSHYSRCVDGTREETQLAVDHLRYPALRLRQP